MADAPTIRVVGAAILQGRRCLAARRSPTMSAPGRWEFPGGKVEPGEEPGAALTRELREELCVEVRVQERLGRGEARAGDGARIVLDVYRTQIVAGSPKAVEHDRLAWLTAAELASLSWADADVPIVPAVVAALEANR